MELKARRSVTAGFFGRAVKGVGFGWDKALENDLLDAMRGFIGLLRRIFEAIAVVALLVWPAQRRGDEDSK